MSKKIIKLTSLLGNRQWLDGGAMFGNVPQMLWKRWFEPDDKGRIRLDCRCLLVQVNESYTLFETGIGFFMDPKLRDRFGVESTRHELLESLSELGVTPESIDNVVLSHLHFDHAGGLLPAFEQLEFPLTHNQLLFPRATYIIGKEAFQRAQQPHERDRASFIAGLSQALEASGRMKLVDRGQSIAELKDWLEFRFSDGHTPGQMHGLIRGNHRKVFFAGDLIPGAAWVHAPITMGYDRFPEKIIDEKKKLYEDMKDESWLVFFTHDPRIAGAEVRFDSHQNKYLTGMEWERFQSFEI